jgi:hypothetical protein
MPNLENLRIERLVLHEVFIRPIDGTVTSPRYSNELAQLDAEGLRALRDRLVIAIGKDSHCMEMEIQDDAAGSALRICSGLLRCDDDMFLQGSKDIARKLNQAQDTRSIPGGIVVVLGGKVDPYQRPFVAIIKAEEHGGFMRLDGDQGIMLRYLSTLLLTPQQRLFKIGIFVELEPQDDPDILRRGHEFQAFVYDHLMRTENPAVYFYQTFLGCTIARTAKQQTKKFYDLTKRFVDELSVTNERKLELNISLSTYLRAQNRTTLHTEEFGEFDFSSQERIQYREFMAENAFPSNTVPLDRTLIQKFLRVKRLNFSNSVRVVAPLERFDENVKIESGDEFTTVRIRGSLIGQS